MANELTRAQCIFMDENATTLQDIWDHGVTICTAATKPAAPFEGQTIYVTDNAAGYEQEAWDGAAWQSVGGGGGGLANIVEDTTPQLGGDLDCNGYDVTGCGEIVGAQGSNMVFTCDTSGAIVFRKVAL